MFNKVFCLQRETHFPFVRKAMISHAIMLVAKTEKGDSKWLLELLKIADTFPTNILSSLKTDYILSNAMKMKGCNNLFVCDGRSHQSAPTKIKKQN